MGRATQYTYNARGQIASVTTPDNHTTHYSYTALGHLASSDDDRGTHTEYAYDGVSQVVKRVMTDKQGLSSPSPISMIVSVTLSVLSMKKANVIS